MKPIILIGGVAGTGKTSLSNLLQFELKIDHKIGLGWIRETLCTFHNQKDFPELYNYSFNYSDPNNLDSCYIFKQTELLKKSIEACINRAHREGTSLIIEGVNLIPGYIKSNYITNYFWLEMPNDFETHKKLLLGDTHANRIISDDDIIMNRNLGKHIQKNFINGEVELVRFDQQRNRLKYIKQKILKNGSIL